MHVELVFEGWHTCSDNYYSTKCLDGMNAVEEKGSTYDDCTVSDDL